MMLPGEKIRVTVGGERHIGTIVGRRDTAYGPAVEVQFWHQGRQERMEFFTTDGALSPLGPNDNYSRVKS